MSSTFEPSGQRCAAYRWLTALCTVAAAAGCIGVHYPTDLSLASVTAVTRQDDLQVPGRVDAGHALVRPTEPVLKVTFRSRFDLASLARTTWLTADAVFCKSADRLPSFTGSPAPNMAWASIFADGRNISEIDIDASSESPLARDPDGSTTYHAYIIPFIRPETYPSWIDEQRWDLTIRPHDVCLTVRGHKLSLFQATNTMRIDAAMIASALGPK